jgi:lipopolysaccharide/colanic/teichoic acid biosynthesis glycosyltransferase
MTRRAFDVSVAATLLVVLSPLAALAAVAIAIDSRGGVLYHATRMGRGGRPFTMWKLRTMRTCTGGTSGARITSGADPRVTRVGRLLRRLHLDEWPQLVNVLRGEMSLVGPRPEDPALVDPGDDRWRCVLSVRPGITGPTQLSFASREAALLRSGDAEDVYRRELLPAKLASDVAYIEGRSLVTDLRVLARTLIVPFRSAA